MEKKEGREITKMLIDIGAGGMGWGEGTCPAFNVV